MELHVGDGGYQLISFWVVGEWGFGWVCKNKRSIIKGNGHSRANVHLGIREKLGKSRRFINVRTISRNIRKIRALSVWRNLRKFIRDGSTYRRVQIRAKSGRRHKGYISERGNTGVRISHG